MSWLGRPAHVPVLMRLRDGRWARIRNPYAEELHAMTDPTHADVRKLDAGEPAARE